MRHTRARCTSLSATFIQQCAWVSHSTEGATFCSLVALGGFFFGMGGAPPWGLYGIGMKCTIINSGMRS